MTGRNRVLFSFLGLFLFFCQSCNGFLTHHSISPKVSSSNLVLKSTKNGDVVVEQIELSSGVTAEIMSCSPRDDSISSSSSPLESMMQLLAKQIIGTSENNPGKKPPLIFIHGSFHASWCWTEHYFSFFQNMGYPCYALSLRGTGGTYAGDGITRVKISEHVQDVSAFIDYVIQQQPTSTSFSATPPVLIGHSFGGMPIMKYLELNNNDNNNDDFSSWKEKLSGVILLCSVPPSGNGKMTMRFLQRSLRDSWKITAGLAMRKVINDDNLCRTLFFGDDGDGGISDDDLHRIQGYFLRDTVATIDLRDLAGKLPSNLIDVQGRAPFLSAFDPPLPALVIGAKDDFIVDKEGVEETATYFGVDPIIVDSPHDVMLGNKWANTANIIKDWLETII